MICQAQGVIQLGKEALLAQDLLPILKIGHLPSILLLEMFSDTIIYEVMGQEGVCIFTMYHWINTGISKFRHIHMGHIISGCRHHTGYHGICIGCTIKPTLEKYCLSFPESFNQRSGHIPYIVLSSFQDCFLSPLNTDSPNLCKIPSVYFWGTIS